MSCPPCAAEFHFECYLPVDGLCCCEESGPLLITTEKRGPLKDASEMVDPISTGRKRAAVIKPIEPGMVCEWAGLLHAGGGVESIIGCNGNVASAIHHGPDKDILNNDPDTNLHRICVWCHNRWHTNNDRYYGTRPTPGTPFVPVVPFICKPHDPDSKATLEQMFENELSWSNKQQLVKAND